MRRLPRAERRREDDDAQAAHRHDLPNRWRVLINGISVQKNRKRALADAGVLIESPEIYPSLTPNEALEMVADLRGVPARDRAERIRTVLAEVKMSDWANQKVGRFSKGMKQRINIAAALVHDPQVVILDEPSTGLDPRGMAEVRTIVRDLKKSDRLIFMSSHILSEVTEICDEVALIDHGKLLFYDTLNNVTARFTDGQGSVDAVFARPVPGRRRFESPPITFPRVNQVMALAARPPADKLPRRPRGPGKAR